MDTRDHQEPMDQLAAFILARVDDDEEQAREDGTATTVLGERLLIDGDVKRRLDAHVQRIDWTYEPAGEQDYMWTILDFLALPWRNHPDYQSHWSS